MSEISRICRICFDCFEEDQSTIRLSKLDEMKIKMLTFLRIKLNIALIENQVLCLSCTNKLQQFFKFKSITLNNFGYLTMFEKDEETLICIENFVSRPDLNRDINIGIEKVCFLCLTYYKIDDLTSLNISPEDGQMMNLVYKCLPEIDSALVAEPSICKNCLLVLQNQFNFMETGCHTEKEIARYINLKKKNSKKLDIRTILHYVKIEKKNSSMASENDIKNKRKFLLPQANHKIGNEENVNDISHSKTVTRSSKVKKINKKKSNKEKLITFHACPYCPYRNSVKANLTSHLLVHEKFDESSSNFFKCDLCDFHSKWRSSLLTHKLLHKSLTEIDIFQCYHCSYQTKYKKHLRRHITQIHQSKTYICEICNYETKSKMRFEIHSKHNEISKSNQCKKIKNKPVDQELSSDTVPIDQQSNVTEFEDVEGNIEVIKTESLEEKALLIKTEPVEQESDLSKNINQVMKLIKTETEDLEFMMLLEQEFELISTDHSNQEVEFTNLLKLGHELELIQSEVIDQEDKLTIAPEIEMESLKETVKLIKMESPDQEIKLIIPKSQDHQTLSSIKRKADDEKQLVLEYLPDTYSKFIVLDKAKLVGSTKIVLADQEVEVIKTMPVEQEVDLIKPGYVKQEIELMVTEPNIQNIETIKIEPVDQDVDVPLIQNERLIKIEVVKQEVPQDQNFNLIKRRRQDQKPPIQEYQQDNIYSCFNKIIEMDGWYYLCNSCKYQTKKLSHMRDHVLKHQKISIKCNLCDYKAKYERTLRNHIKTKHK